MVHVVFDVDKADQLDYMQGHAITNTYDTRQTLSCVTRYVL